MRACDLCADEPIAHVATLGRRADRRVWLCRACFGRHDTHALAPSELLALARLVSGRSGRCEWCEEERPAAQVRVVGSEGRVFAFHLCPGCAQNARQNEGGRVLEPEAVGDGEPEPPDPRYVRAVEIARRRRAIRRVR